MIKMSKKLVFSLLILGLAGVATCYYFPTARAIIWIEGHITSDTSWTPVDTYRVINDTYVDAGATLTISPGVQVQFADGFSLFVQGSLNATGTDSSPIVFTSSRLSPSRGVWGTIKFMGSKSEYFLIKNAYVEFAVYGVTVAGSGLGKIEKSRIYDCSNSGLYIVDESNLIVRDNLIDHNTNGITYDQTTHSEIVFLGNTIRYNDQSGARASGQISNITFVSNTICSNGWYGMNLECQDVEGHIVNVTISSNNVTSNGYDGIRIYSGGVLAGYILDLTVQDNILSSNRRAGAYIHSNGYLYTVAILNNTIAFNGENGVTLDSNGDYFGNISNVTVAENTVLFNCQNSRSTYARARAGISIYGYGIGGYDDTNPLLVNRNITVSNNVLGNNPIGIYAEGTRSSWPFRFSVAKNKISMNSEGCRIVGGIIANITENFIGYNKNGVFFEKTTSNLANNNDICFNSFGMNVTSGATVNAEYNFWSDSTGPYHPSLNPEGKGNSVNGNGVDLDFIPFLTVPHGHVNQRPIAALSVDKNTVGINETVTFGATNSTDEGRIDYYLFDFGDGMNSSWTALPVVTHSYASKATYYATVTVMDDYGVTSNNTQSVILQIVVIPEFPSFLVLPLFMLATLLAVMVYKRKHGL